MGLSRPPLALWSLRVFPCGVSIGAVRLTEWQLRPLRGWAEGARPSKARLRAIIESPLDTVGQRRHWSAQIQGERKYLTT